MPNISFTSNGANFTISAPSLVSRLPEISRIAFEEGYSAEKFIKFDFTRKGQSGSGIFFISKPRNNQQSAFCYFYSADSKGRDYPAEIKDFVATSYSTRTTHLEELITQMFRGMERFNKGRK